MGAQAVRRRTLLRWMSQSFENIKVSIHCIERALPSIQPLVFSIFVFLIVLLLSSNIHTRRRFYPQRSNGQAVVEGRVVPSPPVRAFIFIAHRVHHPTARRFSSSVTNSRSRAFRQ